MASNDKWIQRVIFKLNGLHLDGIDFREVWTWVFDWDEQAKVTENFNTCRAEESALVTLERAGAIHAYHKDNFMRDQNEEQQALHGWDMWAGWDRADPALRMYDYIWYVDRFEYDKFMEFCNLHGFSLNNTKKVLFNGPMPQVEDVPMVSAPTTLTLHKLEPKHYSQRTGKLTLSPTVEVTMAAKGTPSAPDGEKYLLKSSAHGEAVQRASRALIKHGINFRTVLSVNDSKIDKKVEKKISNMVAEINKKVVSVGGPNNLIMVQNKKVFVNNSYL